MIRYLYFFISFFFINTTYSQEINNEKSDSALNYEELDKYVTIKFFPDNIDSFDDIYGLDLNIQFNPQDIDTNNFKINTTQATGIKGVDYVEMYKIYKQQGLIKYAITGINENFSLVQGKDVINFIFKINPKIKKDFITIDATSYKANNYLGEPIPLSSKLDTIYIKSYSQDFLQLNTELYDYSVYPNPAGEKLNLLFEFPVKDELIQINLINSLGNIVSQTVPRSNQITIDVSTLPSATYFVQAIFKNFKIARQFTKD